MTTYTRQMLVNEAWSYLSPSTGQSPEAEDSATIDAKIDALIEELSARDIVEIADTSDIEPRFFARLAECLADECAPSFSLPKNPVVRAEAEDRLRVINRKGGVADNKLAVDVGLTTRPTGLSIARWTSGV